MNSSQVHGVIFDLGSTLIDFEGDYAQVIPESLAAIADHFATVSTTLDRTSFIDQFGQTLDDYHKRRDDDYREHTTYAILRVVLARFIDPLPGESELRDGLSAMYAVSEAHWQPKQSMLSVLQQLSSSGYKLGLLSNAGDEANVQRLIDKVGIRAFFDPILISAALGIRKPDPRPLQMILEQWGLPASEVVMVGDLLEADILGAQRAGIHQIWLCEGRDSKSSTQLEEIQPEAIAADLTEVPVLIQRWNQKG